MAGPYVEAPEDEFEYTTDWLEVVDNQAPHTLHMTNDVQEAELVGWVRANKIRACCRWLLGFSYADTATPWLLRRENPQWHPEHPQLRCYDASARFSVPLTDDLLAQYPLKKESPFGANYNTANYKWSLVTARYRNYVYRFREDGDLATPEEEWRRNCWVMTEPRVEALTVSGGQSQLTYCESSTAAGTVPAGPGIPTDTPSVKTPFPAPIAALLSKKGVVINWYDVPWEYLSDDPDIFTPTKLDAIAGKVNSDLFLGRYEPGTLLAEPYRYTISTWAVAPEDQLDALRKVNLAIPFTFFDPPRGATRPPGAPFARGHNLMPWGGNGTGVSPGGNGLFYLATRDGSTTGPRLVGEAPFSDIFTHVLS